MNTRQRTRRPAHSCEHSTGRSHRVILFAVGVLLLSIAGHVNAEEPVKAPELYARVNAGLPGNFDTLVVCKDGMVFKDIVPVLITKGALKVEASNRFDAERYTDRNKQYVAIAYAMQGYGGMA